MRRDAAAALQQLCQLLLVIRLSTRPKTGVKDQLLQKRPQVSPHFLGFCWNVKEKQLPCMLVDKYMLRIQLQIGDREALPVHPAQHIDRLNQNLKKRRPIESKAQIFTQLHICRRGKRRRPARDITQAHDAFRITIAQKSALVILKTFPPLQPHTHRKFRFITFDADSCHASAPLRRFSARSQMGKIPS